MKKEKNGKFSLVGNCVEHSHKLHGLEKKLSIISTNENKNKNSKNLFAQSFLKRIAEGGNTLNQRNFKHDPNKESISQSKLYFLFENDEIIEKSDLPIY